MAKIHEFVRTNIKTFFTKLRSPGVKIPKFSKTVFGRYNLLILKVEQTILIPSCFSSQGASNHVSFDLERSRSKFDLRSSQGKVTR